MTRWGVEKRGSTDRSVAVWRVTSPHIATRQSNAFPVRHRYTLNGRHLPKTQEKDEKETKYIILSFLIYDKINSNSADAWDTCLILSVAQQSSCS